VRPEAQTSRELRGAAYLPVHRTHLKRPETNSDPAHRELEALSEQLRALARRLVRDPGEADDLVQEAWLASLNKPRAAVAELGAWLRVVLRNLAARRSRREVLRRDAEARNAVEEATSETEELLERSNVALALREAAYELAEPVRSVIVLHYFEGLTMEATAVRLERPLETVRSQRKRGIDELRGILDRRHHGARRDWLAALAPLLRPASRRALRWRAAAAAFLFCGAATLIAWLVWRTPRAELAGRSGAAPPYTPEVAQLDPVERDAVPQDPGRTDVALPAATEAPPPAPSVPMRRFAVRVTDAQGQPVEGARVSALGHERSELGPYFTDAGGRVEFELPEDKLSRRGQFAQRGGLTLNAYAEGQAKSMFALVPAADGLQQVELQLRGRGQSLVGSVVGPDGEPVAKAYVDIDNDVRDMLRLPNGVAFGDDARNTWSDASGRFEFHHLPLRPHRWLARGPDLGVASGAIEGDEDALGLVIHLPRGMSLSGTVRGPDRAPVVGAEVWVARGFGASIGAPTAVSGADGRYELKGISESPLRVFSHAAGPQELSADEFVAFEEGQEHAELDLELTARPALRLRFVTSDGAPCVGGMATLQTAPSEPAPWRQSVATDVDGWAVYPDYASSTLVVKFLPVGAAGYPLAHTLDPRVSTVLELRVGEGPQSSAAPVRASLVDPLHSPMTARLVAISRSDQQPIVRPVDPRTGVLEGWLLPAGERWFYAVDEFGALTLGHARLDGVSPHDLGVHTLGSTRAIELDWSVTEGEGLFWTLYVSLVESDTSERILDLPHGRARLELRDGCYVLVGRSPQGLDRVRASFFVGPGHPTQVLVR
jgi:RNA polymerase sigma-70 factor (ECF subfamily)